MAGSNGTIAPLQNVALCIKALERAIKRPQYLPGMVCFYGPSGWGKTFAACFTANKYKAFYVECRSTWTRKAILKAICKEMGIAAARTIYDMTDQIIEHLRMTGQPLLIDEMDHIVEKQAVNIIRDLYDGSGVPILLIGEERIPVKLKKWERFHGRILDWVPAQPADIEDARVLMQFYCKKVQVGDDLLDRIVSLASGSVRRIVVNLARVEEEALGMGVKKIGLKEWGKRPIWTGEAPARRLAA